MNISKGIKISVCMITYGHEAYIQKAIEGVLMQIVDFEIELIVADDCSPDQTSEIVKSIQNNHKNGEWIKYTKHKKNMGMMPNFIWALEQCKGKYIALCEGDDYWTDPLKLQKQVVHLEENLGINICFHKADIKKTGLNLHTIPKPFHKQAFNYIELLKYYNFITTASVVFRKPINFELPKWFETVPFGDLALYKIIARDSQIQCIDEVMSVYRIHEKGVYSGLNELKAQKNYFNFYKIIFQILDKKEKQVVKSKVKKVSYRISKLRFSKNRLLQKIYNQYLRLTI